MSRSASERQASLHQDARLEGPRPPFQPIHDIVPRSVPQDVQGEIEFHLDMVTEELVSRGWEPAAARTEAQRRFGDRDRIARDCRQLETRRRQLNRRADMFDALRSDVRFAFRQLALHRTFTLAALLTLTLGIGAVSTMLTLLNGVLLRPLPYPEFERIAYVWEKAERGHDMRVAQPNAIDWIDQSRSFSSMAYFDGWLGDTTITGIDQPVNLQAVSVSRQFFDVLRTAPIQGRVFGDEEQTIGAPPTIVVSHRFWQRHLGGAPIADRSLNVYGTSRAILGIMPPQFDFPPGTDLWLPAEDSVPATSRTSHNWSVVGRLADGVSLAQARAEMTSLVERQATDFAGDYDAADATVRPILEQQVGSTQRPLFLLAGAAVLVLLLAATNLASGLIARAMERSSEMALRGALGAGGGRLVRQLVTESVVLTTVGGLLGAAFAYGAIHLLRSLGAERIPRLAETTVDARVLGTTLLISALTGVLFGLLPALHAARTDIRTVLSDARSRSRSQNRLWSGLIAGEVALALLLVTGSFVLLQELWVLLRKAPGFQTERVLTLEIGAQHVQFPKSRDRSDYLAAEAKVGDFQAEVLTRLTSEPGIESIGLTNDLPLGGFDSHGAFCIGTEICWEDDERRGFAGYRVIAGDYFETLGIPLLAGRSFDGGDSADSPFVALVNQAFAERYFQEPASEGASASPPDIQRVLDQQILSGGMDLHGETPTRIVGVVGNVLHNGLDRGIRPTVYYPMIQRPMKALSATYVVRSTAEPATLGRQLEGWLRKNYPDLPPEVALLEEIRTGSVADRRFTFTVLCALALVALGLALTGVWAVTRYRVALRHREIGIRIALGLQHRGVMRLVLGDVLRILAIGTVVGGGLALAAARLVAGQIPESDQRPLMFLCASVVLLLCALAASWWPARRATRIQPTEAMSDA